MRSRCAGRGAISLQGGMTRLLLASILALAGLPACAGLSSTAAPPLPVAMSPVPDGRPGEYPGPTGRVAWTPRGAAAGESLKVKFDDWSVVGAGVRLERRPDGMWSGTAGGRAVTLSVTIGQVSGSGVDLAVDRQSKVTRISGSWMGVPLRIELEPRRIGGTAGPRAIELVPMTSGAYEGAAGALALEGVAATAEPPMPQLALALVAALVPPPGGP